MFGDIAHGALVLFFGIYLLRNEGRNRAGNKELDVVSELFGQYRYLVVLMGFFSVYCGFMYYFLFLYFWKLDTTILRQWD